MYTMIYAEKEQGARDEIRTLDCQSSLYCMVTGANRDTTGPRTQQGSKQRFAEDNAFTKYCVLTVAFVHLVDNFYVCERQSFEVYSADFFFFSRVMGLDRL